MPQVTVETSKQLPEASSCKQNAIVGGGKNGNFQEFAKLENQIVDKEITYICKLRCKLVGHFQKCGHVLVGAAQRGLVSRALCCSKCQYPHHDEGKWIKVHKIHICKVCNHFYKADQVCGGKLLARVVTNDIVIQCLNDAK